jgi:hypothetical protein
MQLEDWGRDGGSTFSESEWAKMGLVFVVEDYDEKCVKS